jgi:hypothetical protein
MIFQNCTDHRITVIRSDGTKLYLEPSGPVARIRHSRSAPVWIRDVPIRTLDEQKIVGLPKPRTGTLFVTSSIVAQAAAALGRDDVIAPDTTYESAVRRGQQVLAVRGFQAFGHRLASERPAAPAEVAPCPV